MTLLGTFALWAGLLFGVLCAGHGILRRLGAPPAAGDGRDPLRLRRVRGAAGGGRWRCGRGSSPTTSTSNYVADYTSRNLPSYYLVSAFWAGQKGLAAVLGRGPVDLRRRWRRP